MNAINAFSNAVLGWLDIPANRQSDAQRFDPSRRGLIVAVICYVAIVAVLTVVDLIFLHPMTYDRLAVTLAFSALQLVGVCLVTALTMRVLKPDMHVNALLVPVIYALAFRVLLGVPLGMAVGPVIGYTLLGLLGYMLFRGARDIPKFSFGVSVSYAVLGLLALVGPTEALHMLFA